MELIKQHKGLVAVALLLVMLVGVSALSSESTDTNAREDSSPEASERQTEETDDENRDEEIENTDEDEASSERSSDSSDDSYEYVAQPGDSYSVLARKAVQTYGIINDVSLSLAEIVAAETMLAMEANAGYLEVGQEVNFDTDTVKKAMDEAQALSEDEKAAWASYVPYIEFDTRKNGE